MQHEISRNCKEREIPRACFLLGLILVHREGSIRHGAREDRDQEDRERDEPAGDLLEAAGRAAEEGQRARRALRRPCRRRHLLQHRQDVRVLQPYFQVHYYFTSISLYIFGLLLTHAAFFVWICMPRLATCTHLFMN